MFDLFSLHNLIPEPVRHFIDAIFGPPTAILELVRDRLNAAALPLGRGISIGNYFSFFGYLPTEWRMLVQSILASITLLATLWLARSLWDLYLRIKNSTKWW